MILVRKAWLGAVAVGVLALGLQAMRAGDQQSVEPAVAPSAAANAWARNVAEAQVQVDHTPWTTFLQGATVEERGVTNVAYSALRGPPRQLLDGYIAWLLTLTPSEWSRDEQLAYWLNLHNALTVQAIAEAGGRGSIDRYRQFPVAVNGPFAARTVMIEGQPLSIDAIVHEVLRPNFADTAFHYGLFSGAKGGPSLRRTAFTGSDVRAALEMQARAYVNGRGARVSRNEVQLSSLYEWYGSDFGGSDEEILRHIGIYADDRLKSGLSTRNTIGNYRYDLAVAAFIPRRLDPVPGRGDDGAGARAGNVEPQVGGGS